MAGGDIDPIMRKGLEDALDALYKMERLIQKLDASRVLSAIEALKDLDLEVLRELAKSLPHTELDMRMARLRIQSATGIQPPALLADADRTPVEPIQNRRRSSATLRLGIQDPDKKT